MSLKIEDLFRKIKLPKKYFDNSFVISEKYSIEAQEFLDCLENCDGSEFAKEQQNFIYAKLTQAKDIIIQNIKSIQAIYSSFENADLKTAQEEFDLLMHRIKNDIFISTIDDFIKVNINGNSITISLRITSGHRFFRVRAVDNESPQIQNNAYELFHVPLSKRAYVSNERFSLAGFPSLYLATMLPLAWQESGYPKNYYYSEYQYKYHHNSTYETRLIDEELQFISLYSPDEINIWGTSVKYNNFPLWAEVIIRYLKTYPLVLACSFVNQSGKESSFKQEYVIPQMLMQWVQRNSNDVQGISYFSCIDSSTLNSSWCAYNIAIPAIAPFDDNKFSIKLREEFFWTNPIYHTVAISDTKKNETDREILYKFTSKIRSLFRTYSFPQIIINYVDKMVNIANCLLNLLDNGKEVNIPFALSTLDILSETYCSLRQTTYEQLISDVLEDKSDIFFISGDNSSIIFMEFKKIYDSFIETKSGTGEIGNMISKYKNIIWNDMRPYPQIIILYHSPEKLSESQKLLESKHILYSMRKIVADDSSLNLLKELATSCGKKIDDFWGSSDVSDECAKQNMNRIISPIFIKQNDISIYSDSEKKFYGGVQIGYDYEELCDFIKFDK